MDMLVLICYDPITENAKPLVVSNKRQGVIKYNNKARKYAKEKTYLIVLYYL